MDKFLLEIIDRSKDLGVVIDKNSIQFYEMQGFMSKVYAVNSNSGKLIIHIGVISPEQERQKIWEKIHALSYFLHNNLDIPVAKVFVSGKIGKSYFLVQEMLSGRVAGKREIIHNKVVDTWYNDSKSLKDQVENIAFKVNNLKVEGYGWLYKKDGKIKGSHVSWLDFLEDEVDLWLKQISKAETGSDLPEKLKKYFNNIKSELGIKESYLIHGDLVNPSNILIEGGEVTGLVDWEWALAGDPAWEFAFNNIYSLDNYLLKLKSDKGLFLRRIKYYNIIYLIWGLYMHSMPKKDKIYVSLREHLRKLDF